MVEQVEVAGFGYEALRDLSYAVRPTEQPKLLKVDTFAIESAIDGMRADLTHRVDVLIETLANPTATAGQEMLRRGVLAWQHRWWDDASEDLRSSIAAYPYRGAPYFFLGLSLLASGDSVAALREFRQSIKYGEAGDAECAVGAALMADALLRSINAASDGTDVLRDAARTLPACFDVLIRLADSTGESEWDRHIFEAAVANRVTPGDSATGVIAERVATRVRSDLSTIVHGLGQTLVTACDQARTMADVGLPVPVPGADAAAADLARLAQAAQAIDANGHHLNLHLTTFPSAPTGDLGWCVALAQLVADLERFSALERWEQLVDAFGSVRRENQVWLGRSRRSHGAMYTGQYGRPAYRNERKQRRKAAKSMAAAAGVVSIAPSREISEALSRVLDEVPRLGSIAIVQAPLTSLPMLEA